MHIDGYVIPVPEAKKQAFLEMAEWFDRAMIEFGALQVVEGWEKDVPEGKRTDFRKAVMAEEGEKIVFSWIVWPDKATADAAHERVHEDERFKAMTDVPFDGRRMIFGSFEPLVNLRSE
ncbi:RNA signal recognition particle 4.5S RNA [Erythrobacter sp. SG61-1L]|uniref:DUF1428 domain-containing protein n=1 Tax=Erythrobacter sp. SG61-1L TaxID=1603897 RepID=UPI0006C90E8E|nr:DUF1428 domain-containing protein [Erythrobacter sp. SG61-1L]KPL67034.1 RNA signal recognition particle 4.5S RNA [Erythrobacter sp. SG61-1L]